MTNDEYLHSQVMPLLQPGEQILHSAYMRRQPGLAMQMLVVGGLLLFLITKAYFVVLTNRRMILIRTKMGFWGGGPKQMNLEVEQWDIRNLRGATVSGIANNRSMTFQMAQGPAQTLRISPWFKSVAGTKAFFETVPGLLSSGQLQQLALSAPQQQQLAPGQQPMQQQMQQPPQQQMQQMQQQPMQMQQPQMQPPMQQQGFPPGSRVMVTGTDGNRYPATIAQFQNGQYYCTMQNGQSYWFPAQSVANA